MQSKAISTSGVLIAALVILLAAALRFWDLSSAHVWMDEAFTILIARLPLGDILFSGIDNHPPLFYAIQHIWMSLAPSVNEARIPAAVMGVLCVIVLMLSVRDLWSGRAALWAGALLSVSTAHVYYSQDARMYPLVLLTLCTASWGLAGLLRDVNKRHVAGYASLYFIGSTAAVYSHLASSFFLASANVGALVYAASLGNRRQLLLRLLLVNLAVFVVSVPWLTQLLKSIGSFPGLGVPGFRPVEFLFFLRNAIGYPGLPRAIGLGGFGLLLITCGLGAWYAIRKGRSELAIVWGATAILYASLLVVLNLQTPILAARVLLPLLIPVAALAGISLAENRHRILSASAGAALVTISLVATINEHFHRMKYDDPEAGLSLIVQRGWGTSPVVTCKFFDSASVLLASELLGVEKPLVITMKSGEYLRFDQAYFDLVKKSMASLRTMGPTEINRALAGDRLYKGKLVEALNGYTKASIISTNCGAFLPILEGDLANAGMRRVDDVAVRNDENSVMERGETEVLFFSR